MWHISDFAYPAKRVELSPPAVEDINLEEWVGEYYSRELETTYWLEVQDGSLMMRHSLNWPVAFRPIATDEFISDSWFLSSINAVRDGSGKLIAIDLSGQIAHDIRFVKRAVN